MRLCTKKHGIYGHFSRISALSFPHLSLQPSVRLFEMISSSDEEFDEGSDVRINWDDYEPQSPIPHIAGEDEADEYRPQSPEFFSPVPVLNRHSYRGTDSVLSVRIQELMEELREGPMHTTMRLPTHVIVGIMSVINETTDHMLVKFQPYTNGKIDMRRLLDCRQDGTTRNERPVVHVQRYMSNSEEYEYEFYLFKHNSYGWWRDGGREGLGYVLERRHSVATIDGGDGPSHTYFEWQTSVVQNGFHTHVVTIAPYRDILYDVDHDIDFNL